MAIAKTINETMNEQAVRELSASMQYLGIAAFFDQEAFPHLAEFFYRLADTEQAHAAEIIRYIVSAGGHVALASSKKEIKTSFTSVEDALSSAEGLSSTTVDQIKRIMHISIYELNDHAAYAFLQNILTSHAAEAGKVSKLLKIARRLEASSIQSLDAYARP